MIIPVLHRILIKQDKLEESNKDYLKMKQMGLVMPDLDDKKRAQASVDTGIVVLVGPTHWPNVAEHWRISTATSNTSPTVQRTSFA